MVQEHDWQYGETNVVKPPKQSKDVDSSQADTLISVNELEAAMRRVGLSLSEAQWTKLIVALREAGGVHE